MDKENTAFGQTVYVHNDFYPLDDIVVQLNIIELFGLTTWYVVRQFLKAIRDCKLPYKNRIFARLKLALA